MNEDEIDQKIVNQYLVCRKNYYKSMLGLVLGSLGTIVVIVGSLIVWSYGPMRDITILKMEVRIMQEKLDVILKINGYQKKIKEDIEVEVEEEEKPEKLYILNPLEIDNPSLTAVCEKKK